MSTKKQKTSKFNTILFQAVYEGLNSIGASIPPAILSYLEKDGSIGPGRVINDPKAFDEGLKRIFGFGAKVIEKKILEILYEKLRIQEEVQDRFNFSEEIQNVQKILPSVKMHVLVPETVDLQY